MSNKNAIPSGQEITSRNVPYFEFCNVTHLAIKNNSDGAISYNFGGTKFTLLPGKEDPYPSPNNPMTGKIKFDIPQTISSISIKIRTVQL